MGTRKFFITLKTQFDLVDKGFLYEYLYEKMHQLSGSFWVSVFSYVSCLFGFILRYFFRFLEEEKFGKDDTSCNGDISQKNDYEHSNFFNESEFDGDEEKEKTGFTFHFQSPKYLHKISQERETEDSVFLENAPTACTNKYQFVLRKDLSGFVEEPEIMSFEVRELGVGEKFRKSTFESESIIQEFDQEFELTTGEVEGSQAENSADQCLQDLKLETESNGQEHAEVVGEELSDSNDEYIEFEPHLGRETESTEVLERSEEPSSEKNSGVLESNDQSGLEILWEHKDLVEQLRLELRRVRTRGLPTILEESEFPKMVDDLKQLKIDEKFEHKDRIEEIQNFYKCYNEKMRKLDILNYQTLHAIGFLQLKDRVHQKQSFPTIKSLLFHSTGQRTVDPTMKFITELRRDLEMVYVGQVCLSWEILRWQYEKARELQEHDPNGFRRYNQVICEYQQFQVLLQRFIENEPFQGPRVQNYVKNRCVLRNLLQVPVIKDDFLKERRERGEGEEIISSAVLMVTIEESMRVFSEFVCAEKAEANVILKGLKGTSIDLEKLTDLELLTNIQTNLHKKERRLKDLVRSGNCIVKRFKKHQEGRLDYVLLIAQIELKLVSRVLNMSRLRRDQLEWCHKKLSKINFINRKIHVESSFLLFPC